MSLVTTGLQSIKLKKAIIQAISISDSKSKEMQVLKRLQTLILLKVCSLQKARMQSQPTFVLVALLRFIFKDSFILIVFLLQVDFVSAISTAIATHVLANSVVLGISLFAFVLAVYALYVGGREFGESADDFSRNLLPFVDVATFPVVTASLAIVHSTTNVGLIACGVLSVLGMSFFSLCYNLLNFSKSPRTANLFQFRQAKAVMGSYVLQVVFCYYLAVPWSDHVVYGVRESVVYCSILLLLTAVKFRQKIIHRFYISSFAQKTSSFFYFMELNLACIAEAVTLLQTDLVTANIAYILIIMSGLAFCSLLVYLQRRDAELYLSSAHDIRDEVEALLYLDCLAELSRKVENEEEDIILISLKTKHELGCAQSDCFCRTANASLKNFIASYIKCELQVITAFFRNDPGILLSVLFFKMVLFKSYPEILCKLAEYEARFSFSLLQRFYRHSLTAYLRHYISRKNVQIDAVESEQMFRLEQTTSELQKLIKGEVEMREKMWKYLSRGLCQVGELQLLCGNQLASVKRVMQIYHANRQQFRKSKHFNLLILFYFTRISFLSNGRDVKANLKEIYYGYKVDELHSIKQFKKFIYHKRCCSIQTHIDPKAMGLITAASHNVEEMFGLPYERVMGASINSLMPEFMGGEHESIMERWGKGGTWRTIGKLKEIYCIHKEQHCFSALLYLKIYVKEAGLHFITNIFKLNDNDYLVVNSKGRIEGAGRKFFKIFGEAARRMPLNLLIETKAKDLSFEDFEEGKTYRRVFMSVKGVEREVQNYFQTVNNGTQTVNNGTQTVNNGIQTVNKGSCDKSRLKAQQNFYDKLRQSCLQKYFVEFTARSYRMGRLSFWVLQMVESRAIQRSKTAYFLEHTSNYICSLREHLGNELDFDVSERKSQGSLEQEDAQDIFDNNCNSSIASTSQKENYPLSKIVERFLQLLQKPQEIRDQRLQHTTCGLILFVAALTAINFISYLVYAAALTEIQNFFFAASALSDIMQTTEIAYDRIYNLRAQLAADHFASFDSELRSALYLQGYVYGLKQYSFAHLVTHKTSLTKEPIYAYIENPAEWQTPSSSLSIQTYQFLQNFYYLTGQLVDQLQTARNARKGLNLSKQGQFNSKYLQLLINNFPQLKRMNEFYLQSYQARSDNSRHVLDMASLASMALHFAVTLLAAFLLDSYYRFRFTQIEACFRFYGLLPHSYLEKLRDYYSQLSSTVIQEDQLRDIANEEDKVFAIDTHDLFAKADSKVSFNSKLKLINYSNYYRWIFATLAFLSLNGFNYMGTNNVRDFFGPSQQVIELINELTRAENRLLESYFDLKASYYIDPAQLYTHQYFADIKIHLNTTASTWSAIANKITAVLSPYDPSFRSDFRNSLVSNVCSLSAQFLPQSQRRKCVKELQLNILEGGLMMAMNYFQVSVQGGIEQMRTQYLGKSEGVSGNWFQSQTYTELDKMQIYMFKIYQVTQSVCYRSYSAASHSTASTFALYVLAFSLLYALLVLLWLAGLPAEKQKLSWLYGQLLLVPFNILKSNSRIVIFLKEAVEYSDV